MHSTSVYTKQSVSYITVNFGLHQFAQASIGLPCQVPACCAH